MSFHKFNFLPDSGYELSIMHEEKSLLIKYCENLFRSNLISLMLPA